MTRIALTFGLISAALMSAMALATVPLIDSVGAGKTDVLGYAAMFASALVVFFGVRAYRERAPDGRVTFGRAFAVGVLITTVASACHAAAFQVIYFALVPEFGETFAACMVHRVEADGGTAEAIAEATRQAQTLKAIYDNPATNAAITFATAFPLGLLASAVSAAVLRRRPKRHQGHEP